MHPHSICLSSIEFWNSLVFVHWFFPVHHQTHTWDIQALVCCHLDLSTFGFPKVSENQGVIGRHFRVDPPPSLAPTQWRGTPLYPADSDVANRHGYNDHTTPSLGLWFGYIYIYLYIRICIYIYIFDLQLKMSI